MKDNKVQHTIFFNLVYGRIFNKIYNKLFPLLLKYKITPNILTTMTLLCSSAFIISLYYNFMFGGLILLSLINFFDIIDGAYARLTNQTSDFGFYWDRIVDHISVNLTLIGLSFMFQGSGLFSLFIYNLDIFLSKFQTEIYGEKLFNKTPSFIRFFSGICAMRTFLIISLINPNFTNIFLIIYFSFVALRCLVHFRRIKKGGIS